ncbi:hypothetical protein ACFSTH_04740 [Paenibacillus yanchengensis]
MHPIDDFFGGIIYSATFQSIIKLDLHFEHVVFTVSETILTSPPQIGQASFLVEIKDRTIIIIPKIKAASGIKKRNGITKSKNKFKMMRKKPKSNLPT